MLPRPAPHRARGSAPTPTRAQLLQTPTRRLSPAIQHPARRVTAPLRPAPTAARNWTSRFASLGTRPSCRWRTFQMRGTVRRPIASAIHRRGAGRGLRRSARKRAGVGASRRVAKRVSGEGPAGARREAGCCPQPKRGHETPCVEEAGGETQREAGKTQERRAK